MISVRADEYTRAKALLPKEQVKLAYNLSIEAHWLENERLLYCREIPCEAGKGKQFVIVNTADGAQEVAFDHEKLARALQTRAHRSMRTGDASPDGGMAADDAIDQRGAAIDPWQLPFDAFEFEKGGAAISFLFGDERVRCDLASYNCEPAAEYSTVKAHELCSPDGKWTLFVQDYNLWLKSRETGAQTQLTRDGAENYSYGTQPDAYGAKIIDALQERRLAPMAIWSPDSTKIFTHRMDQRLVRELHVNQFVPEGETAPPVLHSMRYALPGDRHVPRLELVICDLTGGQRWLDAQPLAMSALQYTLFDPHAPIAWWSSDSTAVYYLDVERGAQGTRLRRGDVSSGEVQTLLQERSDTFLQLDYVPRGAAFAQADSDEAFVWLSPRTGFDHLYLYEGRTGVAKTALTSGEWRVEAILCVDRQGGWVYFLGNGREAGRHPYYRHLYRVSTQGGEPQLLTPEDAEHSIQMAPDCGSFVDAYSRVDAAPVSVLRRADGTLVAVLVEADITPLLSAGYQMAEPFSVKARDGVTDLYGVMIKPAGFDPEKRYPVIDYEYGGVHTTLAPVAFPLTRQGHDRMHTAQSWAQLGFVVIVMDGLGTPGRSQAFYDACRGHLGDAAGLPDHVTGVKQLAERFPYLDLDRVGIYGFSGGGYGSARALMQFPDFYKVAVAGCGDHENSLYSVEWGERYQGLYDADAYAEQSNERLADRLQGKLLLVHGDIDDNVHLYHTMRLADALIKADKDFDLLILPNRGHSIGGDPYLIRRLWDYFITHLREPVRG